MFCHSALSAIRCTKRITQRCLSSSGNPFETLVARPRKVIDNKKITRLESDVELADCEFKGRLINRNPRNLEQLSFEAKPEGFWLDESPPSEWNKLIFVQEDRHLSTFLKHWSGRNLVEASTKEPQLLKYFRNTNTIQAATILGQVMSRRCLQSGYLCVGAEGFGDESQGIKLKAFFDAIVVNGLELREPPEIKSRRVTDL